MNVLFPLSFGLIAWAFGIAGLMQVPSRARHLCSALSLGTCGLSLYCCLYIINQWVQLEDASAIYDCTGAFLFCAGVLLAGTFLLNALIFLLKPAKQ